MYFFDVRAINLFWHTPHVDSIASYARSFLDVAFRTASLCDVGQTYTILGLLLVDHALPDCVVNLPQHDTWSERAHWAQAATDGAAVGRVFS